MDILVKISIFQGHYWPFPSIISPRGFPLSGVVSFMSEKESVNFQIPEMIIVGIDTKNRLKDLIPNSSNNYQMAQKPNGK